MVLKGLSNEGFGGRDAQGFRWIELSPRLYGEDKYFIYSWTSGVSMIKTAALFGGHCDTESPFMSW